MRKWLGATLVGLVLMAGLAAPTRAYAATSDCTYNAQVPHISSTYYREHNFKTVDQKTVVSCPNHGRWVTVTAILYLCKWKPGSVTKLMLYKNMGICRSKASINRLQYEVLKGKSHTWMVPAPGGAKPTGYGWWVSWEEIEWTGADYKNVLRVSITKLDACGYCD